MREYVRYPQRSLSIFFTMALAGIVLTVSGPAQSNSGPGLRGTPPIDCVAGVHERQITVAEGANGEFKAHNIAGNYRFDASDVVFDGIESDGDTLEHWPVAVKAADKLDRQLLYKEGSLTASSSSTVGHSYSFHMRSGLKVAHFYAQFSRSDPGKKLYMKLTDPSGNSAFYNRATDGYESVVVNKPIKGTWKVSVAMKLPAGSKVRYTLRVDDDASIELDKIKGTLAGDIKKRHHNVLVPRGLSRVHFFTQFRIRNFRSRPYVKLIDPSGNATFHKLVDHNYLSIVIENPRAGRWVIRPAVQVATGSAITYTINVSDNQRLPSNGCWYGGEIYGAWDENGYGVKRLSDTARTNRNKVTWEHPYHNAGGLVLQASNFLIENVSIVNHGDGIQTKGDNNVIDGAYLADIHDDCIENDSLGSLLIKDSFFDGCYVAFSARPYRRDQYDGSKNLFEIRDTLVRLEKQPTVFLPRKYGPDPGHGNFFKWESDPDKAIKLAVHNSIFLATDLPLHGGGLGVEEISNLESCSNNVIVWTGPTAFPNAENLPRCFRLTTDYSVWRNAVSAWRARHRGRPSHP